MNDSNLDLATFQKIVDGEPDNISFLREDVDALIKYVGLLPSSSFQSSDISTQLYKNIRHSFSTDPRIIDENFKKLKNELIYNHVLSNINLEPYFSILTTIHDALGGLPDILPRTDNWKSAIQAAYDHVRLNLAGGYKNSNVYARQFQTAYAALRLRKKGYEIILKDGNIYIEGASERQLTPKLENLVKAIGGIDVAAQIYTNIKSRFDPIQSRYHLVRNFAPLGGVTERAYPFGYLLGLAVKYPFIPRQRTNIETKWRELIELSTDYAAVCDVQPYSQYELMFNDGRSLVAFLQDIVIYDAFFTIPQVRPYDALKIARGTLSWLNLETSLDCGWSISEALEVAHKIFEKASVMQGPICFHARELGKKTDWINLKKISNILKLVFSHSLPGANQNFNKPTDIPGPDFFKRPLLALGNDNYCLIDKLACASAVIEALLAPLRDIYPGLDDKMGTPIETFLCSELEKKGVTFSQGKYKSDGKDGECDLVIETSDRIIFLEIKKKPLTRKARAGSDVALLIDLAGSLLQAQLQAGWHEVRLRKAGYLDLLNQQSFCTRISLNGRDVERIAVTLFDYGGLQDRMLLKQFLEAHLTMNFSSSDAKLQKKLDDLNDKVEELRKQTEMLVQSNNHNRQPFFNCWFLSVPQLLILLDDVTDNDSFKSALWDMRHTWTGSLDFYFDFSNWKRIRKGAETSKVNAGEEIVSES